MMASRFYQDSRNHTVGCLALDVPQNVARAMGVLAVAAVAYGAIEAWEYMARDGVLACVCLVVLRIKHEMNI